MRKGALINATACALGALVVLFPLAQEARADGPVYGGWNTDSGAFQGVDGYIWQGTTSYTTGFHANWITECGDSDCFQRVQTGTFQGVWNGGASYSAVIVYSEVQDVCGDYRAADYVAPPSADYPYYISYNGAGVQRIACGDHTFANGYSFNVRKGSVSSTPFAQGALSATANAVEADTEVNPATTPYGDDLYGCDPTRHCTNQGYGMHLYNGTTWSIWNDFSIAANDKPPWLHTFSNYWTFMSCPVEC